MPPIRTEYNSSVLDAVTSQESEPKNPEPVSSTHRGLSKLKGILAFTALLLLSGIAFLGLRNCGNYLIVDNAVKSDVILIPARGFQPRYARAFELLRAGYAGHVVADVPAIKYFGTPVSELAQKYFAQQPEFAGKIEICVVNVGTPESLQAAKCLEKFQPKKVLIVAGLFQTRRTLKAFSHDVPRYQWSITPAQTSRPYPVKWWTNRELAKIIYMEWSQLLWWELLR